MTQYNFTTNIEHRMHNTGKVYCIDRMTSDYALAHPLDVEGFIEGVYQEFAGTTYEESRETLHKVWRAVLGCKNPCGDRTLYPNRNGGHRPASMKVWLKAGEYWRMGLRPGDTLPCMAPMHRITRLDNGEWIALFPKDAHLLESEECLRNKGREEEGRGNAAIEREPSNSLEWPSVSGVAEGKSEELTVIEENTGGTDDETAPVDTNDAELEQLRAENERLQEQIAQMANQPRPRRQRKPRKPRVESEPITVSQEPIAASCQASDATKNVLMMLGGVMALSLVLFIVLETGLLIPLGLIGLATGGILK